MAQEVSSLRRKPANNGASSLARRSPLPTASPGSPLRALPRSVGDPPSRSPLPSDDPVDAFDVPAAILCAFCGQADCSGCAAATEDASGVIAIVPWERSGSVWSRLWATANATTQGAEAFFAVLPDGEIQPAMRFAVVAELLAVGSMVALLAPFIALALPTLALEVLHNPSLRESILRWVALGVPGLALWMVVAHITHGAALNVGARRQGGPSQRRRAVRFGLYACGWDLMTGPLGAVVTLASKGLSAALELLELAVRVPGRATVALLQGVYKLPPEGITRARRVGAIAAVLIALFSGLLVSLTVIVSLFSA
jgi:hypothetical protein